MANTQELLSKEAASWAAFIEATSAVPEDRRSVEGPVPGWSTHDLVWHCAFWTGVTADILEQIRAGDPDPPEPPDTEQQILDAGRAMSWDDMFTAAEGNRERARAAFSAFDDPPQNAIEWIEDDTFSHYDEHAEHIRAFN